MKTFSESHISNFVKYKRGSFKLKQEELAEKAGVGLRFLRELEQGKESLRMDKVNQVLHFFGHRISPLPEKINDPYAILLNGLQKKVKINSRRDIPLCGTLVGVRIKNDQILSWMIVTDDMLKEYRRTKHLSVIKFVGHADIVHWKPL
jgi:y4mF family transcriptional regulator